MNSVSLIGNVTKDIVLKTSEESGKVYAPFTLAINNFKESGKEKSTLFIHAVAFGSQAEVLSKYITKGQRLAIEGRLADSSYLNKEGKKVYGMDIIVEDFTFVNTQKVATA